MLYPGNYVPSPTHRFIKALENRGKLLRNFTQNIDGLGEANRSCTRRVVIIFSSAASRYFCMCALVGAQWKLALFNEKFDQTAALTDSGGDMMSYLTAAAEAGIFVLTRHALKYTHSCYATFFYVRYLKTSR